jgi:hypothetical protein
VWGVEHGGEQQREPAPEAEADHTDLAGAVVASGQPFVCGR